MTFDEWVTEAIGGMWAKGNQRLGQYLVNSLPLNQRHLDKRINGTEVDPYYNNDKIPEFMKFVEEHWED